MHLLPSFSTQKVKIKNGIVSSLKIDTIDLGDIGVSCTLSRFTVVGLGLDRSGNN